MATNEQFRYANHLPLPVPAGTKAGDPVRVGSLNGVAQTNVATADDWAGGNHEGQATVWLDGSHRFRVNGAVNLGDPVYFPTSGERVLTPTSTGVEPVFGVALASQAGAGTIPVKILPISVAPAAAVEETEPETQRTRARAKS